MTPPKVSEQSEREAKAGERADAIAWAEQEAEIAEEWAKKGEPLDSQNAFYLRTLIAAARSAAPEDDYQRIIREVLLCDPKPASTRPDDQLEPPWEVIARIRSERDALQKALDELRDVPARFDDIATLMDADNAGLESLVNLAAFCRTSAKRYARALASKKGET